MELAGYLMVAVGALDVVLAVLLLLAEKPPDPARRRRVVGILGAAGFGMILLGALVWLGVLGGGAGG